jgi:ParB-like chromosome segregation protein Spo0J
MGDSAREYHPASMIFPLMDDEAITALADDIRQHGLLEDIVLDKDGRIVDGRNRNTACMMAGVKPRYKTLPDGVSPTAFVISENLTRRHLTKSQAAAAAAEAEPLFAEERDANRRAAGKAARQKQLGGVPEKLPEPSGDSRDDAGKQFGVSGRMVSDAKAIREADPELFEQVKNKQLTLQDAKKEHRTRQSQQEAKAKPWPKRERELQRAVKGGRTVVANVKTDHHLIEWARKKNCFVMVDRTSPWGNPFVLGDDGNRDEVCDKYRDYYLPHKAKLQSRLQDLKGFVIGCHCAPERCHADAIAEAVNAS